MTPREVRLWARLRRRIEGVPPIRRQHPAGPYILDFYCAPVRLAIEVDGLIHDVADNPARDAVRDAWLRAQHIEVLRIPARDILANADAAATGILAEIQIRLQKLT